MLHNPTPSGSTAAVWSKDSCALFAGQDAPCITILLCTYNGARFLIAQLASIEQQSHKNWRLIVSDDGSTDETLAILRHFAERVPQYVELRSGPRRGPCANFLSLAEDPSIAGDYFAFCDEDDVWRRDKLKHALGWLKSRQQTTPAVYCARTRLVGEEGRPFGTSPLFPKLPCFANALVQSIAGANTMVFNPATKRLLEQAGAVDAVSHDWWTYQLVSGAGGTVHYDPKPHLDYRQHAANHIGCNRGLRAQWERLRMVLQGGFAVWNDLNLASLHQCRHLFTSDNQALLDAYDLMRTGGLRVRVMALIKSGVRRQTLLGNLALFAAAILKEI